MDHQEFEYTCTRAAASRAIPGITPVQLYWLDLYSKRLHLLQYRRGHNIVLLAVCAAVYIHFYYDLVHARPTSRRGSLIATLQQSKLFAAAMHASPSTAAD